MCKKLENSEMKMFNGGRGAVIIKFYDSDGKGQWQVGTCTEPGEWKVQGFEISYYQTFFDSMEDAKKFAQQISESGNVYEATRGKGDKTILVRLEELKCKC